MLPSDAWIDDVKEWPEVDDGKLFSYILRTKAVDVDYIGKYKDQKAYSYWMSGFVDTVTWWHLPCAELSVNSADALDSWICQSCLADAANIHDAGDDELDLNL
ncbi:unnamed protein product, partial [Porites lobata]